MSLTKEPIPMFDLKRAADLVSDKHLLSLIDETRVRAHDKWKEADRIAVEYRDLQKSLDRLSEEAVKRGLIEPQTMSEVVLAHAHAHGLPTHKVELGDYEPSDLLGSLVQPEEKGAIGDSVEATIIHGTGGQDCESYSDTQDKVEEDGTDDAD